MGGPVDSGTVDRWVERRMGDRWIDGWMKRIDQSVNKFPHF